MTKASCEQINQREKTLVFCATQAHALAVRDLINQLKTSTDPHYCERVTADDGKDYFTIYDFVRAYEHFNDAEWNGEPLPPNPAKAAATSLAPAESRRLTHAASAASDPACARKTRPNLARSAASTPASAPSAASCASSWPTARNAASST